MNSAESSTNWQHSDHLDRALEQGAPLLTQEILRVANRRHGTTKAIVIGEFAKSPKHRRDDQHPDWMKKKAFDGDAWIDLGIHERKFILRKLLARLEETGTIYYESKKTIYNSIRRTMRVGSVLDLMANIDD